MQTQRPTLTTHRIQRIVRRTSRVATAVIAVALFLPGSQGLSQEFTDEFGREQCTFDTTGTNPYWPLRPGYVLVLEGEEEDDGELITVGQTITVTGETRMIDGVLTRVVQEYETEDDELVEISYNFVASCRETGAVWYFGEDVEDYEDGELVGSGGEWRAGVDGARPGILMPGTPMLGSRWFEEIAPTAQDRAEIIALGEDDTVAAGAFDDVLITENTNVLEPGDVGEKAYARGIGVIRDEDLELVAITDPACTTDAFTHCLADGRFEVRAEFTVDGEDQAGHAILASSSSGEFWFFSPDNSELLVKVLDACDLPGFGNFWVFAAGLTDVEVSLTVLDSQSGQMREYGNDAGTPFRPILDTAAFDTCD